MIEDQLAELKKKVEEQEERIRTLELLLKSFARNTQEYITNYE